MAEQSQFFSELWAARLKNILYESKVRDDAPPMHVPKALVSANPDNYIPQFISLGPYHYHNSKLEDFPMGGLQYDEVTKMSIKEAYKVSYAAALSSRIIERGKSLNDVFEMIESMRPQFNQFYNWPQITEGKNFSLMMVMDSLFLLYFLVGHDRGQYAVRINCDILKLENQIPLFLLKDCFVKFELPRVLDVNYSITTLLEKAYKELSPFDVVVDISSHAQEAERQPHLLGSIHAILSRFLQIKDDSTPPTRFQRICNSLGPVCGNFSRFTHRDREELPIKAYNAWELAKAGINFRSFSRLPHTIRFDKWSHTIYLPRMTVSSAQTETLFRNLHALEFIDADRPNTVTSFIQLMDCLIDTEVDVEVLRKSHVISSKTM